MMAGCEVKCREFIALGTDVDGCLVSFLSNTLSNVLDLKRKKYQIQAIYCFFLLDYLLFSLLLRLNFTEKKLLI